MGDTNIYISDADDKIPFDYFVTKKYKNKNNKASDSKRYLRFVDASGNLVFTVNKTTSSSAGAVKTRLLEDASGNLLISLRRSNVFPVKPVYLCVYVCVCVFALL